MSAYEPESAGTQRVPDVTVVSLSGHLDTAAAEDLRDHLNAVPAGHVVMDLSGVELLGVAGAWALLEFVRRRSDEGGRVALAGCATVTRPVLNRCAPPGVTLRFASGVHDAARSLRSQAGADASRDASPSPAVPRDERAGHDAPSEATSLRRRVLSGSVIAMAQGVAMERYRLKDAEVVFGLLTDASQRFNVKMRHLADAFVAAPPPPGGRSWFPGRTRAAAPAVSFVSVDTSRVSHTRFLDVVRDAAADAVGTQSVTVQVSALLDGSLWLESHRGFPDAFVSRFLRVGASDDSACAAVAASGARVVVADVADDPLFDEASRKAVLLAGSRSVQSTPIAGASGRLAGVFSTHHPRPGRRFTRAELSLCDAIAAQAGAWLSWHRRSRVLDALEHFHQQARAMTRSRTGAR